MNSTATVAEHDNDRKIQHTPTTATTGDTDNPEEVKGTPQKRQLMSEITQEGSPAKKPRASAEAPEKEVIVEAKAGTSSGHEVAAETKVVASTVEKKKEELPVCMCDKEKTINGKLSSCQIALHRMYKVKKQLATAGPDSSLAKIEEEVKEFMRKSIITGTIVDGMTSPSPGFLYICGAPGTGKTTLVDACSKDMKKWAKQNGHQKPVFCFINMAATHTALHDGKENLVKSMLSKIAAAMEIETPNLRAIESALHKKSLVLVIDEVDMLFTKHGGKGEIWFNALIDMAEDYQLRFSMIGISNSVNDADAARVRAFGHSPHEIVFPSYTEEDLLAILKNRVGTRIIDVKALQLISRKIANHSGDARKVLEITSNAVSKCLDQTKEEDLDKELPDDHDPLVKIPHMMKAVREGLPVSNEQIIRGLPQAAKIVLCIAVTLRQAYGPSVEISVAKLKEFCAASTRYHIMDDMSVGLVMRLVEQLHDSGLLMIGNKGRFNCNESDMKLKLGVQFDDVENALEKSLLTEPFYQNLIKYVKDQGAKSQQKL